MNSKTWTHIIALAMFAALALPLQMAAQAPTQPQHQYHHYQIVDPGTFGGPSNGLQAPLFPRLGVLNNHGTLVGFANTAASDSPYCGFGNCYAGDAFQLQDGVTTDLGRIPGGFDSQANWISGNGLIAGLGDNGIQDPLAGFLIPYLHGLLWDHGRMIDLGTLPEGGNFVFPIGVNNLAEVVGSVQNTVPDPNSMVSGYGTQTRAFYWKDGVMQDLGTLGTGTDATAALINERGQVVGWSYTNSTPSAICAGAGFGFGFALTTGSFIWDPQNGMRDIGGLGGSCTIATDLNDRGQIVGLSALPGDLVMHPFVWDAVTGMTDLLGASSELTNPYFSLTINEHGVVAGSAIDAGFTFFAPFVWRQVGGKWRQTSLDVDSITTSINASDQVIGYGNVSFLWEDGGPAADLNTLVPPNSGLQIYETDQINDRGEIAVQSSDASGNNHALLLIPCDENHPDVAGCDYRLVEASALVPNATPRFLPKANQHLQQPWRMNRFHLPGHALVGGGAGIATQVAPVPDFTRPPVFYVSATPLTPSSVNPGGSSTSTVTVYFGTNPVTTAALSCSVQPSPPLGATCSINPTSAAPATLRVNTFGPSGRLLSHSGSGFVYACWLPLIGLVAAGAGLRPRQNGQKRKMKTAALGCALLAGLSFQLACGGGGRHSSGTPTGMYTITVTATAFVPVNTTSTLVTLKVQ